MTTAQSTIPFHKRTFSDDLPKLRDVEKRLTSFLKTTCERAESTEIEAGRMEDEDWTYPYDLVDEEDMRRIKRREKGCLGCVSIRWFKLDPLVSAKAIWRTALHTI